MSEGQDSRRPDSGSISTATDVSASNPRVVPLTPDASDRRYFRILVPDAPSFVLSLYSAPFDVTTLPFVNVATLMARMPVPIPAVLGATRTIWASSRCQDLGDVTLQAHLGAAQPRAARGALPPVGRADRRRSSAAARARFARTSCPTASRSDVEKLTWELDFLHEALPRGVSRHHARRRRRAALRAEFAGIIEELAAEPRVLCHRDYHSRNLMLHEGQLYMIDFQDARMGPDTYDLVSLLRDSYVDLHRSDRRRADRLLPRPEGHARRSGLPPPLRRDGAAAQPEGARHLRLPDDRAPQPGLHPVHPAHAALRPPQPRPTPLRRLRDLLATHVEEFRYEHERRRVRVVQ
jgi:aminoglycoside/choline kinase family phosphotransferase